MDRVTAVAQNDHRWQPQQAVGHLVNFATALLMTLTCSCGSSSQVVCKATFSSSFALVYGWSLWHFSSMAPQTWLSRCGSPMSSGEFQWTWDSSLAASSAWCSNAEKWRLSWLKHHYFVIFKIIQQSSVVKCTFYIVFFNGCVQLHAKLLALVKYQHTPHYFLRSPCTCNSS